MSNTTTPINPLDSATITPSATEVSSSSISSLDNPTTPPTTPNNQVPASDTFITTSAVTQTPPNLPPASNSPGGAEISSPKSPNSTHNISNGAIAGIAIATALAGAAIATAILILIMRGRKKKVYKPDRARHDGSHNNNNEGAGTIFGRRQGRQKHDDELEKSPAINLDQLLPQALDDGSIKSEVESFFSFVEGHVENNFYHLRPFDEAVPDGFAPGRRKAGLPRGILAQQGLEFEELLAEGSTRLSAITSLICAEMIDAIDVRGDPERSLLPSFVAPFVRSSAAKDEDMNSHATRLALCRFRTSIGYLQSKELSDEEQSHRNGAIELLARDLDEILRPFAAPSQSKERVHDLKKVCRRTGKLGMILLSQPAEWKFDWRYRGGLHKTSAGGFSKQYEGTSLVVFPSLVKVTDGSARKLENPRVLLEAKTAK